jgi:hypothetical protein
MNILKDMQFLESSTPPLAYNIEAAKWLLPIFYPEKCLPKPKSKTSTIPTSIYAQRTVPWNRRL